MTDNDCEYNQEGFCILQNEYPEMKRCAYAKGDLQVCTAKESDLIEICEDCGQPIKECECGTNWVLVETKDAKIVPVISKEYYETVERRQKA